MKKYLLVALLLVWSSQAYSDDIDLYIKNTTSNVQRPNVLIILDNSGSMGNVNSNGSKANSARGIIIDLINDNPSVDFALQIFNNNNSSNKNGGRVISGFNDLSIPANKTALLDLLDADTNNTNFNYKKLQESHTPLCEALYETYRYFSGGEVFYGIQNNNTPKSIVLSGNYTSPFSGIVCNKEITIIYITDGAATNDTDANNKVKALTGKSDDDKYNSSFLGVLGNWMGERNWHTPGPSLIEDTLVDNIVASVKIHTVGFGSVTSNSGVVGLLKLAARDGEPNVERIGYHDRPAGGKYHKAASADDLKTALQDVIEEVLDSSSLTSASVSANSFDRTQTLDSVYYGMFEPSTAARWQGNLKKYKIVNGVQVDSNGISAVNSAGEFDENAKSFWSTTVDGNDVNKGGVAEMLRATSTSDRNLLTDIEGIGSLTDFSYENIAEQYTTATDRTELFDIDLSEDTKIASHTDWAMGVDVDDDDKDSSTTDVRDDVFGDPLHSKPIVINYATGGTRIVVGTNAGVLHMFKDDEVLNTVTESWAYLPKEFFKNIKPLRENAIAVDNKIYGVDGEITLYINDLNGNGQVDPGDAAWLFFGLRRGGSSYYALDVTTPDAPRLMWHIKATGDFNELGQTWSKPQVVRSAYNTTDSDKLVVIFGGGYDTNKDTSGPNAHNDAKGASVYMVNARTGARIFKQGTNTNNGIASSIATLDSDNDALVDRLYVGDTGGNLWRIDMPDATLANRSIVQLASVGGTTDSDDIRFFNKPSIVRTYILETINTGTSDTPNIIKQEVPYDAILLGSGDRSTPTNKATNDMFFMFKDKYINTQRLDNITPSITAITLSELYDYTDDPFKDYPNLTTAQEAKLIDASLASGWHFDLQQGGEKNSAEAIVINSVVYFTTYTPAPDSTCSVTPGDAWLYAVDLALGIKKYSWGTESYNRSGDDRIKHMGSQFLGQPTLISTLVTDGNGVTSLQGDIIVGKEVIPVGFNLQTMRTSLTIEEDR
jgi:type IV pilus assembly protein PilY1